MNKGLLIVVSGPSGAGKGTICKQLLQDMPEIKLSVSTTTRRPRIGEIEGVSYHFISKELFENLITQDAFLEYAKVYDNYYGTPKKYVIDEIQKGNDVLLEIDIQGALQVKKRYPNGVFIFILPPSMEELRKRLINRDTETKDVINKRFESAFEEINYVKKYDYCIINDEIGNAVAKIKAIVIAEKCKVTKDIEKIISKFKEEL